jgi:cytoskeletal protein CcmA (bactofilin family)
MVVRGDIETVGVLKVEGAVEGSIQSRVQVLVARGGSVSGDIETVEAVVGGTVRGAIRAQERVEIQSGAVVNGDITTSRIAVAEGGSINGQIRMGESGARETPRETPEDRPEHRAITPPSMTRPSVSAGRLALPPRVPGQG